VHSHQPRDGSPELAARRIAVIGCGHVGLVMAAGFAHLGHRVIGVDRDPQLVAELEQGRLRIQEEGLPRLIAEGVAAGRLRFTTDYDQAIPEAEFIFLAVDTPQTLGGASDLRNLRAAAGSVAASLNGSGPIVVNKSTAPVGTGDMLEMILWREVRDDHPAPRIVANPEFLQQGRAVRDFFEPTRVVVGAASPEDAQAVADLYTGLPGEVVLTSRRTAEMIKYVANAFLATRVSFINEMAQLCEAMGVDVDDVVAGVAQDERIGSHFFRPGIGYGGSCLPKDTASLRFMGETTGVNTPLMAAVQQVNDTARTRTVRRLRAALGSLEGRRIAVWGLTFKGDTEDTRQSPAMEVVQLLVNEGAHVIAYDPSRPTHESLPPRLQLRLAPTALEAVDDADALAILSDWREFASVPLGDVAARMRGDLVLDGRNVLDAEAAGAHGLRYLGVGRGRPRRSDTPKLASAPSQLTQERLAEEAAA
jgi:UDPglucose 6-dehydrogenase